MKWNILTKNSSDVIATLLKNRGITDREKFFYPPVPKYKLNSQKAITRIKKAVKNKEEIVVYGDYDADGICATAIMWECLAGLGAKVMPFIPQREDEGYGLSIEGIKKIKAKLIITVDSGVVAHEAVDFANQQEIDVIILDHHEKPASPAGRPKTLPKACAIIHTTDLCASGIAYFLAKELTGEAPLELAAIATVTDLMPLVGINRSIVKHGLEAINKTTCYGLRALFAVAGIEKIGTYELGYMIGPRLNASGRIESALTALRLLCTHSKEKAQELAELLNQTNKDRQDLLAEQTMHALENSIPQMAGQNSKIIVLEHESYHQGIIGLIAGKLVEKYYLPAIVISQGETVSKASARSISGFNIIEAIRVHEDLLINAGGHPMAAGFSIKTSQIANFKSQITKFAEEKISPEMLEKTLRVDLEIPIDFMNLKLYKLLTQFAPFGIGNPEPVFASDVTLDSLRTVGADGKHLKMIVSSLEAIAFNKGELVSQLKVGDSLKIAYSLDLNTFNGNSNLQLKVKDILI